MPAGPHHTLISVALRLFTRFKDLALALRVLPVESRGSIFMIIFEVVFDAVFLVQLGCSKRLLDVVIPLYFVLCTFQFSFVSYLRMNKMLN